MAIATGGEARIETAKNDLKAGREHVCKSSVRDGRADIDLQQHSHPLDPRSFSDQCNASRRDDRAKVHDIS
ncbi:hypothetical protein [Rhizobium sp. BK538]|uniref:hypothetical protein n=1 Tax=Rhizobium sp. BK538 TaxID=2586984 RepID=UPI00161233D2|nr:hypothetical protein [Rhizobium sp. BK538]